MLIKSTRDVENSSINILVYGMAGVGKTWLIRTLPNPVILSAEGGLLSLADVDIQYMAVGSMQALDEAYALLRDNPAEYESICVDSLSEIAEVMLANEKLAEKDPRKAYMTVQDRMYGLLRAFKDDFPGKTIYMTAKLEKVVNEMGTIMFSPSMPGQRVAQALPYFLDEVFALRFFKDPQSGQNTRWLQTTGDESWVAKDRSGRLEQFECPDLGLIIRKIKDDGGRNG